MAQRSEPQAAAPILIATCRADPATRRLHDDVPLAAGEYRVVWLTPRVSGSCVERRRTRRGVCATDERHHGATQDATLPAGDVLLVVHGFNCTALDGIETACHVRNALTAWGIPLTEADESAPRPGAMTLLGFTWPCEHTMVPGYMADKATVARFAAFSLANLLIDLRRQEPGRRIHIVAHSMGCFLTLKALNMLAVLHTDDVPQPLVNQVVWYAPDVNADALERSTPSAPTFPGWRALGAHPRFLRSMRRAAHALLRPEQIEDHPSAPSAGATTSSRRPGSRPKPSDHPLDGYGYAALDTMEGLRIYSSLYDEALVVSPWANHTTEESTSASGAIRLGWCGPLHPQMTLAPRGAGQAHQLTLVECSDVAHEHGDYFFSPIVQRDLASHLSAAQGVVSPIAPPSERCALSAWHASAPLQYPPAHGKPYDPAQYDGGLTLLKLRAAPDAGATATTALPGTPTACPPTGIGAVVMWLWQKWPGPWWVRAMRTYYRV